MLPGIEPGSVTCKERACYLSSLNWLVFMLYSVSEHHCEPTIGGPCSLEGYHLAGDL